MVKQDDFIPDDFGQADFIPDDHPQASMLEKMAYKISDVAKKGPLAVGREMFSKNPGAALDQLPMAGAVAGGLAGAGAGSIPLAGIGAAGGEAFRQIGKRALGLPAPETSGKAALDIGIQGAVGAVSEGLGQAVTYGAKAAAPYVAPVGRGLGKVGAKIGEFFSGVPAKDIARLAVDPAAHPLVPAALGGAKSIGEASQAYGDALTGANLTKGLNPNPDYGGIVTEAFKKATAGVKDVTEDVIKEGVKNLTPQEAFDTYNSVKKLIKGMVPGKDPELFRSRIIFQNALTDYLGSVSGELATASKEFGRAALSKTFSGIFPQSKYGQPSIGRALFGKYLIPGGQVIGSPAVQGAVVAGGSALVKGAAKAIENPVLRRGGLFEILNRNKAKVAESKKVYADTSVKGLQNYTTSAEAHRASLIAKPGQKFLFNGNLAKFVEPGRKRGKGAPLAIQFVGSPK